MLYNDLTFTIAIRQESGYSVTAVAEHLGRVSETLPPADLRLQGLLSAVAALAPADHDEALLRTAGEALFAWLTPGALATHLRLAWDRAERQGRGLRLCLSIDAPEINAWPWELLHDPARDHSFGASASTPLVRYLDRTDQFGALAELEAELPLHILLVVPQTPDLDLARERSAIEEAIASLQGALQLRVLNGLVTRTALADALLAGQYCIVHGSGHGGFVDGRGYVGLNKADGATDWVDSQTLARFFVNYRSLKLVILNVCSSGRLDDARAFQGLAPQLVRRGVPAVIAMQYPLTDEAALQFAREFYRRLCLGQDTGRVDVAVAHARNMLAILSPGDRAFAAPVLYTHAADGVVFTLPREAAVSEVLDPGSRRARLAMLVNSLECSLDFEEDWALADRAQLATWRGTLQQAEEAYWAHLASPQADVQRVASQGLAVLQARLEALDATLR